MRALALGLGCAILAGAAHASGIEEFKAICVQNNSESTRALAAADAAGWGPAPAGLLKEWQDNGQLQSPLGRMKRQGDAGYILMVADSSEPAGGGRSLAIRICSIITNADPIFAQAAVNWAGVPSTMESSDGGVYPFVDQGGEHIPVKGYDDPAMLELVRAQKVRMVFVQNTGQGTSIGLGVPWKLETH